MIERDTSYSPDVELDHDGRMVFARDVAEGQVIQIPFHMVPLIRKQRTSA